MPVRSANRTDSSRGELRTRGAEELVRRFGETSPPRVLSDILNVSMKLPLVASKTLIRLSQKLSTRAGCGISWKLCGLIAESGDLDEAVTVNCRQKTSESKLACRI